MGNDDKYPLVKVDEDIELDIEVQLNEEEDCEFLESLGAYVVCADENGWNCVERTRPTTDSLTLMVMRSEQAYQIEVLFNKESGVVTVMCLYELLAVPLDILSCLSCLSEINTDLELGYFLYIEELHVISWRIAHSVIGTPGITIEQASAHIAYTIAAMDACRPKFAALKLNKAKRSSDLLNRSTPTKGRA